MSGTAESLGTLLHATQDSFSHAGLNHVFGQARVGSAPDKTYYDPEKADRMAYDTYVRLIAAGNRLGTMNSSVAGSDIAPHVRAFTRARTAADKSAALARILSIARQRDSGVCDAEFASCQ